MDRFGCLQQQPEMSLRRPRQHHEMSPIATVALGRLLTGGAMMGTMMKNDSDVVTIQIKGNGPIGA